MKRLLMILTIISFFLPSCFGPEDAKEINEMDMKFGDSHFKTTVMLLELHKKRFGEYPKTLKRLKYIGLWDNIAFQHVEYKRLENGYKLDLKSGWISFPDSLKYPDEFWKGLGCVTSNLKK